MQTKTFKSILSFALAFGLIISLSSCNGGSSVAQSTDSTPKATAVANGSGGGRLMVDDGLYSGYAKAADFEKLKGSIITSYLISTGGILTMNGWVAKGGSGKFDFSTKPDIVFTKGVKTAITLGENDYVGNISIDKKAKDNIDKTINSNRLLTYIILVPMRDGNRQLHYKILLSDNPNSISLLDKTTIETSEYFDPCPPRSID
jgi:hypothetical protein